MKKIYYFLFLASSFAYSQNIEVLQLANQADQLFIDNLSKQLKVEGLQLIDTSSKGINTNYTYLPNNATQEEIEDFKIGNNCEKCVTFTYTKNSPKLYLKEVRGNSKLLSNIWKTYVNTNTSSYKNKEAKIWYNYVDKGSHAVIQNMSNRQESQW